MIIKLAVNIAFNVQRSIDVAIVTSGSERHKWVKVKLKYDAEF